MVQTTIERAELTRERRISVPRIVGAGCGAAVLVLLVGAAIELVRFGRNDAVAASRVEQDVRATFASITADVQELADAVARDPQVVQTMASGLETDERIRTLFDAVGNVRTRLSDDLPLAGITIYDTRHVARAWAGRASDLPGERPAARPVFVTPSPLGVRLVHLESITSPGADRSRLGSVAVEHVLSPVRAGSLLTATEYVMPTTYAQVQLRLHDPSNARSSAVPGFTVAAPDGTPLVDVFIPPAELTAGRQQLRRTVGFALLTVLAVTLLLLGGPLLDARARARDSRGELRLTIAIVAVVLGGAALLWLAFLISPASDSPEHRRAVAVLLGGASAAAVAAALVSAAVRLRVALRGIRQWPERSWIPFVAAQLLCGGVLAALLVVFERLLGGSVDPSQVDLRHFSLHPWTAPRLATLSGVLLGHAAVLWAGALACVIALARWRLPRRWSSRHLTAAALWLGPTVAVAAIALGRGWEIPVSAIVLGAGACAAAALLAPRLVVWYRRVTAVSRILALFMAFLLPALLVYPSVHFFAELKMRDLIESRYAVEAMNHPQTLQARLTEALAEIDALPDLSPIVASASGPEGTCSTDPAAFRIWSQSVLARARLTSDLEIYDNGGRLRSCFALNFPEYNRAATTEPLTGCQWEIFGEALLFTGAQERNTLHAQRSVCVQGRPIGMIAVHVVFDYRTLPFIRSQSAYFDVFSPAGTAQLEGPPAGDVEFTVYGWGLTTIYSSAPDAWPLDEATFGRVYRSRVPFWTALEKNNTRYHVYFANNRQFIYALGYTMPGAFDHLVRLAELTTLAGAGYALALIGTAWFTRLVRARAQTGRALLREIRASFYRKLFLAFVLASIVPVLTLALVIRTYFAGLLNSDIKAEAARTAAVAQRVVEEYDALIRRGGEATGTFANDDVMVWISQLINQDVNVFFGPELFATSERDLFASGVLPTRTPDDVYRAIVLQRLPSYVTEDQLGAVPYLVAAAPVRLAGVSGALTVPLAFRQHEVEREIDELDRGVHLAALFFILLGAGIGLSMAERIADPIRQLTRATGRIARGDFDARIAVRSSDELRRLVDAFNGMAAELKAQRDQLERTHRLEAWAEMARQVAHEIKNPLTPIQLSAEHLQRVHLDRGQPLGPVLDGCITSILGQVRLLRQIASEFSSFASSPTARRARVDAAQLVHDVVEPYRAGLEGRIAILNEIRPPLPPVLVDRTLVARALANVVENALHAMPAKGTLRITSSVEPGFVAIRVADTGVGMDEEALARVFEPYFSTKTTGTGLGLPIALRNIELSGGHMQVESRRGEGTAVTIKLPLDQ